MQIVSRRGGTGVDVGSAVAVGISVIADDVLWEGEDPLGLGAVVQAVSKINKPIKKISKLSEVLCIVPCD